MILPGTKTTRADLEFVRQRGLADSITNYISRGGAIVGICGGYQMLGQRIDDPDGVEGPSGTTRGLGLLPAITHYEAMKSTVQVRGKVACDRGMFAGAKNSPVQAYEIHMGRSVAEGPVLFELDDGRGGIRPEGTSSADGRVLGTYLHGLFHNSDLREAVLQWLAVRRGVQLPTATEPSDPYDRLADTLRGCLDVDRLKSVALG